MPFKSLQTSTVPGNSRHLLIINKIGGEQLPTNQGQLTRS